jgi:hypothetical protein
MLILLCALLLARAGSAQELTNLALNKPTQTSSISQWSHPDDGHGAVDGVIDGRFGFHTENQPNPWWQVDLGDNYAVTEIVVFNRLDCCAERSRTLSALISADGQGWTPIFANSGAVFGGQDGNPLHIPVNTTTRFVRLQLNEQNYLHLDEVQVLGYTGPGNLALNKPTQTSSYSQWSHPDDGHGAVDGVINGRFGFHTNIEPNPWWQVDLGDVYGITEIVVFNRLDCCAERSRTLSALLSYDGQTWGPIFQNPGTVFGGQDGNPLHIPVNANARFVRLQLNEPNPLHLDEVQVLGGAAFPEAAQAPDSSWLAGRWVDLNGTGITITSNGPTFTMQYDNGRGPFPGQVLDGANISGVFDGATITGVVDQSNVIHWSNNTSWQLTAPANAPDYGEPPPAVYDAPPPTYVAPPPPEVYVAPPPPPAPVGYWDPHPVPGGGWCPFGGPHLHNYEPEFLNQFVLEDGYFRFGWGFSTWTYFGPHPIPGGGWCGIGGVHTHNYRPEAGYRYDARRGGFLYDTVHVHVIREHDQPQRPPPTYRPPAVVVQHAEAHPPPPSVGFKRPPPVVPHPIVPAVARPGGPGVGTAVYRPGVSPAPFHPGIASPGHPTPIPTPVHPGPAPFHPTPAPAPFHPTPAPAPFHPTPAPAPIHPAPVPAPAPFHPAPAPVHPTPVPTPAPFHPTPAPAPVHPAPAPAPVHPAPPKPQPPPPAPPPPPKPASKTPPPKKK